MTVAPDTYVPQDVRPCNSSNSRDINEIQNKKIWKSLRKHILSQREKTKQAEDLRKKKVAENQQKQENKLTIDEINGRLSELKSKREALEEKKRTLLNQAKKPLNLVLPEPVSEAKCERFNSKLFTTINIKRSAVLNASSVHKQKKHNQFNVKARNKIGKICFYNPSPFSCISYNKILYIFLLINQLLMMVVVLTLHLYISLEWPILKRYVVCIAQFEENARKKFI